MLRLALCTGALGHAPWPVTTPVYSVIQGAPQAPQQAGNGSEFIHSTSRMSRSLPPRIAALREEYCTADRPAVRIDAKQKELIGRFRKRQSRLDAVARASVRPRLPLVGHGKTVPDAIYTTGRPTTAERLGQPRPLIRHPCFAVGCRREPTLPKGRAIAAARQQRRRQLPPTRWEVLLAAHSLRSLPPDRHRGSPPRRPLEFQIGPASPLQRNLQELVRDPTRDRGTDPELDSHHEDPD